MVFKRKDNATEENIMTAKQMADYVAGTMLLEGQGLSQKIYNEILKYFKKEGLK